MRAFTGVLAVLHQPTADGRTLAEPAPELSRPLPLPLLGIESHVVGRIDRVWLDGFLLRYSGFVVSESAVRAIADKVMVGELDLDHMNPDQEHLLVDLGDPVHTFMGWRVAAATLGRYDARVWPEMSMTLVDEEDVL